MVATSGYKTVVGFGKLASTDLSAAVPTRTKFTRASRANWTVDHSLEEDPSAVYDAPEESGLGPYRLGFDIEGPLWPEGGLGLILLSVMGDVTTTGAGDPFTHTFAHAQAVASSKSYVGVERAIGSSSDAENANVAFKRFEARGGQSSLATFRATGIGSKDTIGSKTSPTLSTSPPLPGRHKTVLTLDGVTTFVTRNWSWFVDHGNYEDHFDGNSRFRKGAEYQEFTAGFEVEVLFDAVAKAAWQKALDAASATAPSDTAHVASTYAASIKTTGATSAERSIEWTSPKVRLEATTPTHNGRGIYTMQIKGRALHNGTKATDIKLLNSESSI